MDFSCFGISMLAFVFLALLTDVDQTIGHSADASTPRTTAIDNGVDQEGAGQLSTSFLDSFTTDMTSVGVSNASSCLKTLNQAFLGWEYMTAQLICTSAEDALESARKVDEICRNAFSMNSSTLGNDSVIHISNLTGVLTKCCRNQQTNPPSQVNHTVHCLRKENFISSLYELSSQVNYALTADNSSACSNSTANLDQQGTQFKRLLESHAQYYTLPTLFNLVESAKKVDTLLSTLSKFSNASSFSRSSDIHLLLCAAAFPVVIDNQHVAPCSSNCKRTRSLLTSLQPFVNISTIPVLRMLSEADTPCSGSICLIVPENTNEKGYTIVSATSNTEEVTFAKIGGFCLNTECKTPLRFTTDESHWNERVGNVLKSIHSRTQSVFPKSTLPFNCSILPCGQDCVSIGFTRNEEHISQILISASASLAVLSVFFSAVIFFFNRKDVGRFHVRRTLFLFTIFASTAAFPYVFSARGNEDFLCFSDGTIVTRAPRRGLKFWCNYGAWHAQFFASTAVGYVIQSMYAWMQLAEILSKQKVSAELLRVEISSTTWWERYRLDVCSFVMAVIPAAVLSLPASVQQGYEGAPIFGLCSLSVMRRFAGYYNWYHVTALLPSSIFLTRGLYMLVKRFGVFGAVHWIQGSHDKPEGRTYSEKRTIKGLKKFSRQLLFYLILCILSFFGYILFAVYIDTNASKWNEQIAVHIECILTSCSPDDCPPLPKISAFTFTSRLTIGFVGIFIATTWLFSPTFLRKVPVAGIAVKRICSWHAHRQTARSQRERLSKTDSNLTVFTNGNTEALYY